MSVRQIVLQGVPGPPAALCMPLVRMRRAIVLRAAPLRMNLQNRGDGGIDAGRGDPAVAQAVRRMVRNQDAAALFRKCLEFVELLDQFVVAVEVGKQDVVVALHRAVALVAENRGEIPGIVELAGEPHDIRPAGLGYREPVAPLVFDLAVVLADIGPVRVRSERIEVEVVAGYLEAAFQGSLRVPDLIVVVQVPEVVVVVSGGGGLCSGGRCCSGTGQRSPRSGLRAVADPVASRDGIVRHSCIGSYGQGGPLGPSPNASTRLRRRMTPPACCPWRFRASAQEIPGAPDALAARASGAPPALSARSA